MCTHSSNRQEQSSNLKQRLMYTQSPITSVIAQTFLNVLIIIFLVILNNISFETFNIMTNIFCQDVIQIGFTGHVFK